MRPLHLALACVLVPLFAQAEPAWLVLVGEPRDARSDTVMVDANSMRAEGALRLMDVKVSRSSRWVSPATKRSFRSFAAELEVDCAAKVARYRRVEYYDAPLWAGPSETIDLSNISPRVPVAFQGVEPNPRERLLRAACAGPAEHSEKRPAAR